VLLPNDERLPARFWSKVKVDTETCCWEWVGAKTQGYGYVWDGARVTRTHRWAYEALVGIAWDNLELDHLCRNRGCCNPRHLELTTHRENCRRGDAGDVHNRNKTRCPHGHEYTEGNIYRKSNGGRACRVCRRHQSRARKAAERHREALE
jgi:hypothetical protein